MGSKNPEKFGRYIPAEKRGAHFRELMLASMFTVGALQDEYEEFWRTSTPNLKEETGLLPGLQAVRIKPGGFDVPWLAYCEWLKTLSDAQFNELIEDLVSMVEACKVMTGVHELLTVNEAYNFVLWLPDDLIKKVNKEYFNIIEGTWEHLHLDPNLDVFETEEHLAYVWKAFHYTEENAHPLMDDPFGYHEWGDDDLAKLTEKDEQELERYTAHVLGMSCGCAKYNRQVEGEPKVSKDKKGYTIVRTNFYFIRIKDLGDCRFAIEARHGRDSIEIGTTESDVMIRPKQGFAPIVKLGEAKYLYHVFPMECMQNQYTGSLTVWFRPLGIHVDIDL